MVRLSKNSRKRVAFPTPARFWARETLIGLTLLLTLTILLPLSSAVGQEALYPTDDATIAHGSPDWNGCTAPELQIRNDYGVGGSSGWAADALIKFDLSQFGNKTICSAKLKLYYQRWHDNNPAGRVLKLFRNTSDWEECIVTWRNQPGYDTIPTSSCAVPAVTGTWMEWDVTTDVQAMLQGSISNYGWHLLDDNYWGHVNIPQIYFCSKENSDTTCRPRLEISGIPCGDVNCDCEVNLGDIVYLISYLYKGGPPPCSTCSNSYPMPSPGLQQSLNKTAKTASVSFGLVEKAKDGSFEISLEGKVDMEVAGLQFDISYDPNFVTLLEPALTSRTEGLQVFSNTKDGNQRIGIVDLSGQNYIPAGESPLIVLRGRGTDLSSIKIKEAILVDKDANKIPVEIVGEMKKGEEGSDVKESIVPKDFSLSQNLPNPFNPQTEISYDIPNACHVSLSIYNLLGQRTRTLVDEYQTTGHKTVHWDGKDDQGIQVASGIYFYQIQAGDFTDAKKMILMK
jgi:hypothetical protein